MRDHPTMKFSVAVMSAALAAFATGIFVAPTPAAARDYPYCIKRWNEAGPGDCRFTSFRQCQATSSGINADCYINPRMAYGTQPQGRPRRGGVYRDAW
jgi:hypothetical protein